MNARILSRIDGVAIGGRHIEFGEEWIACRYPERPPDRNVMYHVVPDCHGCNIAKEAAVSAASVGDPREKMNDNREVCTCESFGNGVVRGNGGLLPPPEGCPRHGPEPIFDLPMMMTDE